MKHIDSDGEFLKAPSCRMYLHAVNLLYCFLFVSTAVLVFIIGYEILSDMF